MDLLSLATQFLSLAGVGLLVAVLINVGKTAGLVKDGTAPTWSLGINLAGLVALFVLKVFAPQVDVSNLDSVAGQVAQILTIAVGLFVQLGGSRLGHELVKNIPLIGKSFTPKNVLVVSEIK